MAQSSPANNSGFWKQGKGAVPGKITSVALERTPSNSQNPANGINLDSGVSLSRSGMLNKIIWMWNCDSINEWKKELKRIKKNKNKQITSNQNNQT